MANKFLQTAATTIEKMLAPVRQALRPLTDRLAPIREWWGDFRRKHPIIGFFLRLAAWGFLFLFLLYLIFITGTFGKIPSVSQLKQIENQTASEIYSADSILLGRFYYQNRTNIRPQDIPPYVKDALVANEDARFYEHGGIDIRSWGRVFVKTILMDDASSGGGSTISQQLAKNLYPRKQYRYLSLPINKIREMITATRLERAYTKDELLTLYLNTVPFSDNVFGIEVASKRFFNKPPKDLRIEEAATLIGTLKATTSYNPRTNPKRSEARRNVVLEQMVRYGKLSKAASDSLQKIKLTLDFHPETDNAGAAPFFLAYLKQELPGLLKNYPKPDGSTYNIYSDGLKIYTTLHSKMQQYAEESVRDHMSQLQQTFDRHWAGMKPWENDTLLLNAMKQTDRYQTLKAQGLSDKEIRRNFDKKVPMTVFSWKGTRNVEWTPLDSLKYYFCLLNIGFMAMEPQTGYIRAWVGGYDFNFLQYDHVRARRQVGSSFKPIIYTKAVQSGIRPCEYIKNSLETYPQYENWQPKNADGAYGGYYTMEGALTHSVNTVSVKLIMRTGIQPVISLARAMGITSPIPDEPSIALGTAELTLYEMVTAFATYANRGLTIKPQPVLRIETRKGEVIARFDDPAPRPGKRAISDEHCDIMVKMMQSVTQLGTAGRLRWKHRITNDIAGKTGTSQNHSDGWFMGYTPHLVAGVWVGGESPIIRFRDFNYGQGAYSALPVWGNFMRKCYDDPVFKPLESDKFPKPAPITLDSMNCPPRYWDPSELILYDSLGNPILPDSLSLPGELLESPLPDGDLGDADKKFDPIGFLKEKLKSGKNKGGESPDKGNNKGDSPDQSPASRKNNDEELTVKGGG